MGEGKRGKLEEPVDTIQDTPTPVFKASKNEGSEGLDDLPRVVKLGAMMTQSPLIQAEQSLHHTISSH